MTRSVYVIGGAGTGKSTFMQALLDELGWTLNPELIDLHSLRNAKALVTLRGHRVNEFDALYLGKMRESHPGTDGLDRASSPVGEQWLKTQRRPLVILGEGATLATERFLSALNVTTELMLVHLTAPEELVQERFKARGTAQDPKFVLNTVTRSENLWRKLDYQHGLRVDTSSAWDWLMALDLAKSFCTNVVASA